MSVLLVNGNALHIPLADQSVHCIVTSPPYYSLRDYGTAEWVGGDANCDHIKPATGGNPKQGPNKGNNNNQAEPYKVKCGKCGARRVDNQIGLEDSPEAYVAKMVAVFRECWRVLRDDGTLWLNIGDSYAGSGGAGGDYNEGGLKEGQPRYEGTARKSFRRDRAETAPRFKSRGSKDADRLYDRLYSQGHDMAASNRKFEGLKPKDLIGIPWMLAFALRADGWYLRSDIIWHKPNPMPESVTDRCTKSHEYLFLLSKSRSYYYDADAIREPQEHPEDNGKNAGFGKIGDAYDSRGMHTYGKAGAIREYNPLGRNRRSVWTIATSPYPGSHFATYPPALVEPCIKAGTSERGCCPKCGAPWESTSDIESIDRLKRKAPKSKMVGNDSMSAAVRKSGDYLNGPELAKWRAEHPKVYDWQPSCECNAGAPVPCTVFDPFAGSGTTLQVARSLGRHAVGLDLSLKYLRECARPRLELDAWEAWTQGIPARGETLSDLPLFSGGNL